MPADAGTLGLLDTPAARSSRVLGHAPTRVRASLLPSTVASVGPFRLPFAFLLQHRGLRTLAKTPRGWTGARTPSAIKRVRQAERRRAINQPRKSAAKTYAANAIKVAVGGH